MRLSPPDLDHSAQRALPAVTLLFGDEPLLIEESIDLLRRHAAAQDFAERIALTVEPGFDWQQLAEQGRSLSLFASRRLLELRLPGGRPGEAGGKAIEAWCDGPPADTGLVIVCGQLDTRAKQARWIKAVDGAGVVVEHRQLTPRQLPAWIQARLRQRGLRAETEATRLLAYYLEGNLLALAQEIDKLAILHPDACLSGDQVLAAIADQARFSVYAFADACLAGEAERAVRTLSGLRAEGVEPVLLLWALAREVRALARIAAGLAAGQSKPALFKQHNIWSRRAPLIDRALARLGPSAWRRSLQHLARLDRVLKGRQSGKLWLELEQLCLALCGVRQLGTTLETAI